jgi:hypothetical protein
LFRSSKAANDVADNLEVRVVGMMSFQPLLCCRAGIVEVAELTASCVAYKEAGSDTGLGFSVEDFDYVHGGTPESVVGGRNGVRLSSGLNM